MAMTLSELVKEVETAAAKAELGEIHYQSTDGTPVYVVNFGVEATLNDQGVICAQNDQNFAATVRFTVMKKVER